MNHTHTPSIPAFRVAVLAGLLVTLLWMGGCSDDRSQPLVSGIPAETETIVLWDHAPAGNNAVLSAPFTVRDTLAAISNPLRDTPARLQLVAYIKPDCQILRREFIIGSAIPFQTDSVIIPALVSIDGIRRTLDSLNQARIDVVEGFQRTYMSHVGWAIDYTDSTTSFGGVACDTALYTFLPDTSAPILDTLWARRDSVLQLLPAGINQFETQVLNAQMDTLVLGAERDVLGLVLDNRYTLALWMDSDAGAATYPGAVYLPGTGQLAGQGIYLAATNVDVGSVDSSYKASGFLLDMNRFNAADINNPGQPLEVNWTTCFPGSSRPCLNQGGHTLYARVSGGAPDSRLTGTLVLVYKRPTP